jgi:hypothetical protein
MGLLALCFGSDEAENAEDAEVYVHKLEAVQAEVRG